MMTPQINENSQYDAEFVPSLYFIAIAIIFIYLLIRNSGLYPPIPDEWTYSRLSRLTPLKSAEIPSYLYLFFFKYTSVCGDSFLSCTRTLNAIFFVSAAPFIYLVAIQVSSRIVAGMIAAMSVLGPINVYTSVFMPESMFFFVFWVFSWFVISCRTLKAHYYGMLAGIIFGLLALIKPHALFIIPGFLISIAIINIQSTPINWIRRSCIVIGNFIILALITKLVLGLIFAGKSGLNLFGPAYGSFAISAVHRDADYYIHTISQAAISLKGHLMALLILFGVPLVSIVSFKGSFSVKTRADFPRFFLKAYTLAILGTLLIVVAYFAASIVGTGQYESISRLHMRYYNFALPLLLVIAASHLSDTSIKSNPFHDLWPSLLVTIFLIYSIYILPINFKPSYIDCPELRGMTFNLVIFRVLGAIGTIAVIAWAFSRKLGSQIFLFIFMPVSILFSSYFVNFELRQRLGMDLYDDAGRFAHHYIGKNEKALVVAGSDGAALHRTLFQIDNPNARWMLVAKGAQISLDKIPNGTEWLLVIGDHQLPSTFDAEISLRGFELFRIGDSHTIDFTKGSWLWSNQRQHGLSSPEKWGTWSDGNKVVLEFVTPLPKKFIVRMNAMAFGPNTEKPFAMAAGNAKNYFRLSAIPEEVELPFDTDGQSHTLTIEVPKPTSPKSLGIGEDVRQLGIGFVDSLTITPYVTLPDAGVK